MYSIKHQIYVHTSFVLDNCITNWVCLFFMAFCFEVKKMARFFLPRCSVSAADSQRNTTWTTWLAILAKRNDFPMYTSILPVKYRNEFPYDFIICITVIRFGFSVTNMMIIKITICRIEKIETHSKQRKNLSHFLHAHTFAVFELFFIFFLQITRK